MKIPTNFLSQKIYKNDDGNEIASSEVDVVTTYEHIADGFYKWFCAECGNEAASRTCGWPIMGQVLKCKKCNKNNLLLYSGTDRVMQAVKYSDEMDTNKTLIESLEERAKIAEKVANELRAKTSWIMSKLSDKVHNWINEEFEKIRNEGK